MNTQTKSIVAQAEEHRSFRNLLVAYDGSQPAEIALRYAELLSNSFGSEITVAYVKPSSEYAEEFGDSLSEMKRIHIQMEEELHSLSERLNRSGIHNRVLDRTGNVGDVLVQMAGDLGMDLLLMGAHGSRRMDDRRLGSTAEFVLRSMPCPVLTIGPNVSLSNASAPSIRRILFASSLPATSGRPRQALTLLAKKFNARVEIVHIAEQGSSKHRNRSYAELQQREQELAAELRADGLHVSWCLLYGARDPFLLHRARISNADLLLLGVEHPASAPDMMGAMTAIIQHALCPILTVPGLA